jgi:8-oxo-dGTP diphosphatase
MKAIEVVAAVVENGARYLVTRRQAGVHLAGLWEFPGGKVQPAESHEAALVREIDEELAVGAVVGGLLLSTSHTYPEKVVTLYFYRCRIEGTPVPQQGQEMRWVARADLAALEFPAADADLIGLLIAGLPATGDGRQATDEGSPATE